MSYQVLARKWRPTNFKQMVGQEHVLQALVHALDSQRLHHAYLFTGTRGVGKTTIARILARCLSCDKGITSDPCGQCSACTSIEQGRYVDLIEIDAASRTKVEDMRELLENVQYAPTQGRFKIYLIDEVHMLSGHSFNALLKTLEEPPEHVKFLFATTDPQKLPITILSRCLQFNLKNMTPEKIVSHLTYVLSQERVEAEEAALWALARGADGSMRDALSLTDQAIAYTQGKLQEAPVSAMLGTVDQKKVYRLLNMLVARDPRALLHVIADLAEFAPDYASVLEIIVSVFHRVAVEQAVPGVTDNSQGDQERISFYAENLSAEDVQLYYQIALTSRKDLAISPDARAGFEMALLRMMAFQMQAPENEVTQVLAPEVDAEHSHHIPESIEVSGNVAPDVAEESLSEEVGSGIDGVAEELGSGAQAVEAQASYSLDPVVADAPDVQLEGLSTEPQPSASFSQPQDAQKKTSDVAIDAVSELIPEPVSEGSAELISNVESESVITTERMHDLEWPRQALRLGLSGMTQNLLMNMVKQEGESDLRMFVESGHYRLLNDSHKKKIRQALSDAGIWNGSVDFVEGLDPSHESPAMWRERMREERLVEAKQSLLADPNVQQLIAEFDGRMIEDSVVSLSPIE
jgi:DNA polymerase-3 subunit gamma/tau